MVNIPVEYKYTVEDFKTALNKWEDEFYGEGDLFMNFFWGDMPEELPYLEGIGQLESVDTGGGEGDGAEVWAVLKVGQRYFRKTGEYSSWGDSQMSSDIEEVYPKEVLKTEWVSKK
jgi:hypothetical protein